MKYMPLFAALAAVSFGATADHPTGNRITPPTISSISPKGIARGTTVELTVEGLNLANTHAIYFDRAGLKGSIVRVKELPDLPDVRLGSNNTASTVDLGPLPPRNQVTVEVEVSPDADIGPVSFRLHNHLGTSPEGRFLIEPYYGESPDNEPNSSPDSAFEAYLPSILVGAISKPGDEDFFKIKVSAGEELVFEDGGPATESKLQPVISIVRDDLSVVKQFGQDGGESATHFAHKFDQAGSYFVRIGDYQQSGSAGHTYRVKIGSFPIVTSTFPLGLQEGQTADIAMRGYQVSGETLKVAGKLEPGEEDFLEIRPELSAGASFTEVKLAVGQDPEILSKGGNHTTAAALPVSLPVTINGKLESLKDGSAAEDYYRFRAQKGQKLVLEVMASRLGSPVDSVIEVLDSSGKPIEIATVRSVLETSLTLRDHDSAQRNVRLSSTTGLSVGDYLLIGNEVGRIEGLPEGPDDDVTLDAFGGQRMAYFNTTAEAHAIDSPVYKVRMHPPGKQFSPNGLPLVRLYSRNDDGGPDFGKDSRLEFTAPADGEYLVRIADVRGLANEASAYRLNIRPPRPDFRLNVDPANPNVPAGGTIPITVMALRLDGLNDSIDVTLEGLPPGLKATQATIPAGQISATILLSADADAKLETAVPLKVAGRAKAGTAVLTRYADSGDATKLIALSPKPDILVTAETKEVTIEPGGTGEVLVSILRQNGFGGRVPVEVRDLPPSVRVRDSGLNGVLITENGTERSFVLEVLPTAEPIEQLIYVSGRVETRSPLNNSFAAVEPVLLKIKPKAAQAAASNTQSAGQSSAPK
ncbi:MAG: hypothetical protein ACRD7E_22315 [Bryobacteraceae bacterium]